jgi:hypothetical protein
MNEMYDFTRDEIGFLQMGLMGIAQSTKEAVESGSEPPVGFIETLESVINKMNKVIELRIHNENQFDSLTESLTDVVRNTQSVISNPELPINEYN